MRSPSGELIQNSSLITIDQSTVKFRPFTSMSITSNDQQQLLFVNATLVTLDSLPSLQSLTTSRLTTSTVSNTSYMHLTYQDTNHFQKYITHRAQGHGCHQLCHSNTLR